MRTALALVLWIALFASPLAQASLPYAIVAESDDDEPPPPCESGSTADGDCLPIEPPCLLLIFCPKLPGGGPGPGYFMPIMGDLLVNDDRALRQVMAGDRYRHEIIGSE
ncbi:hypothetical protein [Devosia sp.]|uniref:hypothetical protein n=1 Tax=Devosia sp. TaxID=1871048 RepID=UPI0035ADCB24